MPIDGEYKNMTYNENQYSDKQWTHIKMEWKHRHIWGFRVGFLADDASAPRSSRCRLIAWLEERDLIASPLPVIAMVLVFCVIVITACGCYAVFS